MLNVDPSVAELAERRRLQPGEPAELFEQRPAATAAGGAVCLGGAARSGDSLIHLNADAEVSDVTDSVLQAVARGLGR